MRFFFYSFHRILIKKIENNCFSKVACRWKLMCSTFHSLNWTQQPRTFVQNTPTSTSNLRAFSFIMHFALVTQTIPFQSSTSLEWQKPVQVVPDGPLLTLKGWQDRFPVNFSAIIEVSFTNISAISPIYLRAPFLIPHRSGRQSSPLPRPWELS